MKSGNRKTDPGRRLTNLYAFNQASHWFLIGLIIPVLTLFQIEKGYDLFFVALLGTVSSLTVVFLELPTGGLSDTIGRKRVYLLSLVFQLFGAVLLVGARGPGFMVAGMVSLGSARALFSGSIDSWFVDEFYRVAEKRSLQNALARVNVFIPVGLGADALVGGFLPEVPGRYIEAQFHITRYSANFLVMIPLILAQMALTACMVHEHRAIRVQHGFRSGMERVAAVVGSAARIGFRDRAVFLMLLGSLAWGVGFSGLESFWQPRYRIVAGPRFLSVHLGFLTAAYFSAGALGSALAPGITALAGGRRILSLTLSRLLQGGLFFLLILQAGAGISLLFIGWLANTRGIPTAWLVSAGVLTISAGAYAALPRHQPA